MGTQMACRAVLNVREGHAQPPRTQVIPIRNNHTLTAAIPLESGETCVAAVMIAQSENSKLITTAQKTDSEISIVREWLATGKFPACIQAQIRPDKYKE